MKATGPVLSLTALLLLLAALPPVLERLAGRIAPLAAPQSGGAWRRNAPPPSVDPALRPLALLEEGLLDRLREADRAWVPRAEPLPDGSIRYLYKRRPGDPELSIAQIQAAIARPASREQERLRIVELLTSLERAGASLTLSEPIKPGAAAEWDPQARTMRIRPDVIEQGTLEFARVLNHEAVHVAQSCAAGSVGANPRPLGIAAADGRLPTGLDTPASLQLNDPLYADLSPAERRMELEAYSLQNRLDVGRRLLESHCPVSGEG